MQSKREIKRLRLSEWARMQGISRITAYRMLKRGILPLPSERSPTGRWYVLMPPSRDEKTVLYARAAPGPRQVNIINHQIIRLSEWTATRNRAVFTVVREIADPVLGSLPRLEKLLADSQITEIIITQPSVIGFGRLQLLNATLAPQGRLIRATLGRRRQEDEDATESDLHAAVIGLCKMAYGPVDGLKIAHRALAYPSEVTEPIG